MNSGTFTFVRGDRSHDISSAEVLTTMKLKRMFNVDPSNVWLRDNFSAVPVFPNDDGVFELPSTLSPYALLYVEGSDCSGISSSSQTVTPTVRPTASGHQRFRSVMGNKSSCNNYLLKVTKARLDKKKKDFTKTIDAFVSIDSTTANTNYITSHIEEIWGPEYILVTADGNEVADCEATRGLNFWKQSARKFYVVPKTDLNVTPDLKRQRSMEDEEDLSELKSSILSLMRLTKDSEVPVALKSLLNDTFKCNICHGLLKPPINISNCCKSILGCESCVNEWFSGSSSNEELLLKPCPLCNTPRGFSMTTRLTGLDDFLKKVSVLFD